MGGEDSVPEEETRGAGPPLASQLELIRQFYEPLFEQIYENPAIRLADLEQLELIALRYRSRRRFVTDLTLDPPTSTSDLAGPAFLEEDFLVLSTIHSAKGCEWDAVHIIHAADGMIPSDMAVRDEAEVEEERRLFYVAMTRAKDWLYVYFPLRYYHRGRGLSDAHSFAQLTRFISRPVRRLFEDRAGPELEQQDEQVESASGLRALDQRLGRLWES
jgi:DNA helicase-2/ATP-dependent DNA helicase PcrA